jgi:exportin-2 (importin alpha re-exporter)
MGEFEQYLACVHTMQQGSAATNEAMLEATALIKDEYERTPGFLEYLLQVLGATEDTFVAEFTVIRIAAIVRSYWEVDEYFGDRDGIRGQLLELLIESTDLVQRQMTDTIVTIAGSDYPDRWPQLMPFLAEALAAATPAAMYAILSTLSAIFQRSERGSTEATLIEIKCSLAAWEEPIVALCLEALPAMQDAAICEAALKAVRLLSVQDIPKDSWSTRPSCSNCSTAS